MTYNGIMFNLRSLLITGLLGSIALLAGSPFVSPVHSASSTVHFVAFGDFGTGSASQYAVAKAIKNQCDKMGCDFAVTLGDNIYNNGVRSVNDALFQSHFEKPYAALHFPFYMVLGNHDYRGNIQAQIDYSQKSSKWVMPRRYYHFERGPVTFLALDTNTPADRAQQAYVNTVKKEHTTPWLITFGHHPRKTNSVYKNSLSPALKQLVDSLCGSSQMYLSGHEHDQQHLRSHCGTDYLVAGTGAGQRKNGKGPDTLYSGNELGFAWFEVSDKTLYFALISSSGKKLYDAKRVLKK